MENVEFFFRVLAEGQLNAGCSNYIKCMHKFAMHVFFRLIKFILNLFDT